jgi:predicted MPP superfamily phosphohydrolase
VHRSSVSLVFFLAVMSTVVGLIHYYLYSRLVRAPDLGAKFQRVGAYVFLGLALTTPVGILLTRALSRPFSTAVAWVVYGWMGVAILLFFGLVGSEVVRAAIRVGAALASQPFDASRRAYLSRGIAGAVGALALGFAGVGAVSALGKVGVRNVKLKLARFPASLAGFRVVQITDLHIGPTLGRAWLEDVVAQVNALEADLIAITGDLVDGSVADLRELTQPLAELRAKHGVFFVTGNHEYYSGVDDWIEELTRLGVRVLRNERVAIGVGEESFELAGVDDWNARGFGGDHGPDLARALAGRDPSRELVLLAHQPKQIAEAARHGVGLQLSGHTHGGQIYPWKYLVGLDQPYVAGLALHEGTQIYVSCGTGYWGPPMRVGVPSEITLLELARS